MGFNLTGKTYVITGATSGIGLAVVELLAAKGANIIGIGRSMERCQRAEEQLAELNHEGQIGWCAADFRLLREVRTLPGKIQELLTQWGVKRLDGLVNNAATVPFWQSLTPEGYDTQWTVNHLAVFQLTINLLPLLMDSDLGRVLTVSSRSHFRARMHWEDIQLLKNYSPLRAYGQTKLCNVLFSAELDRRLAGSTLRAFAVDPGLVKTDIGMKSGSILARWAWGVRRSIGISTQESAAGIVYLLTEPSIQNASEVYWKHGRPQPPNPLALDKGSARRLWEISMKMTGIMLDENSPDSMRH